MTRDAELYLTYMGSGRADGRSVAWLRDKSGAVLSCAQPEEGVSDQLACEKSKIVLADFPAAQATAAATPPLLRPRRPHRTPTASRCRTAIDRAITTGDFANADRLLADATRRYAGNAAWPPLQQKLAKARADRDAQLRQAEARRLIAEARRFAQVGDFPHAEAMLQDADKQVPGFAETAQARAEIAHCAPSAASAIASATSTRRPSTRRLRPSSSGKPSACSPSMPSASTRTTTIAPARPPGAAARRRALPGAAHRGAHPYRLGAAGHGPQRLRRGRAPARPRRPRGAGLPRDRRRRGPISAGCASAPEAAGRSAPGAGRHRRRCSRTASSTTPTVPSRTAAAASAPTAAGRSAEPQRQRPPRRSADRPMSCATQNARALELVTAARAQHDAGQFRRRRQGTGPMRRAIRADMPEIAIARAELERAKADRARQDAEVRALAASVDAAIARRQYADADRLIADGSKRYPFFTGWPDLSKPAGRRPTRDARRRPAMHRCRRRRRTRRQHRRRNSSSDASRASDQGRFCVLG